MAGSRTLVGIAAAVCRVPTFAGLHQLTVIRPSPAQLRKTIGVLRFRDF
jgi:hypothetical protein